MCPPESVVVKATTYVPPVEKTWVAGLPLDVPPSPKFQPKLYGETPPLAVAVNVTLVPALGLAGEKVKLVDRVEAIVIVFDDTAEFPFASFTVSVTV